MPEIVIAIVRSINQERSLALINAVEAQTGKPLSRKQKKSLFESRSDFNTWQLVRQHLRLPTADCIAIVERFGEGDDIPRRYS